jgi:hypothetical protein
MSYTRATNRSNDHPNDPAFISRSLLESYVSVKGLDILRPWFVEERILKVYVLTDDESFARLYTLCVLKSFEAVN